MDINRFKNAEGRITDSMSQGYSTRLNDDCFYFQIDEEAKEQLTMIKLLETLNLKMIRIFGL